MSGGRALLIGIDGVRLDRLSAARTPHLDALIERGFLREGRIPAHTATISGPMWSTVLYGVWADQHGVPDNETRQPRADGFRDFLDRHAEAGGRPFALVSWAPLAAAVGCGPILTTAGAELVTAEGVEGDPDAAGHDEDWAVLDVEVARRAAEELASPDRTAGFLYFGQVDGTGHRVGTGDAYSAAIERVDALVGQVLAALDARGDREDWTVVVTTDHGHRDEGGHGGRAPVEETVWVIGDRRLPGWDSLDSAGIAGYLLRHLAAAP